MNVEDGTRRVDTDDLVALAIALQVSPLRLLMPATAAEELISLTPEVSAAERDAWRWASGVEALPRNLWPDHDLLRSHFGTVNSPHNPPEAVDAEDLEQHIEDLRDLLRAYWNLRQRAVQTPGQVSVLLQTFNTLSSIFPPNFSAPLDEDVASAPSERGSGVAAQLAPTDLVRLIARAGGLGRSGDSKGSGDG